jgi:L-asparaginase
MAKADSTSRVLVLGLGGTIAMTSSAGQAARPTLTVSDLIDAVPELADSGIDLTVDDVRTVASASLRFADLDALAQRIRTHLPDYDGVVVTQGTDTIEETAYLLDLILDTDKTVVVTGAMRHPGLAGADGPANILAAVRVAADRSTRGLGVLVVLADDIHLARRVRKTHTTSCATFQSPEGRIGMLVEGRPVILNRVDGRPTVQTSVHDDVHVGLLTIGLGEDGTTVEAIGRAVDGLVVAGAGGGHVPETVVPTLDSLVRAGLPVVLASRTGDGPVLTNTYGYPGSERDLLNRGLISAGFLPPLKARILLHALLCAEASHNDIVAAFASA